MREFHIYHCTGKHRFSETEIQPRSYAGYTEAETIDQAYERSQNGEQPWNTKTPCRSTSIGDIIRDGDNFFMVCGLGFRLLGPQGEELRIDAIKKWADLPPEIQEQFEPEVSEEEQRELDMLSAANTVDMNSIRQAGLN